MRVHQATWSRGVLSSDNEKGTLKVSGDQASISALDRFDITRYKRLCTAWHNASSRVLHG